MNKRLKYLIFILVLVTAPIISRILDFEWWVWLIIAALLLIIKKFPKSICLVAVIIFFLNLSINKLFSLQIEPWKYSFDKEKIILLKPENLDLIKEYWGQNLYMPYRIRNVFYKPWLLGFNWLDSAFKLLGPNTMIGILGYSGCLLFGLGLIDYIKGKNRQLWPLIWFLSVLLSSSLSVLVDRKNAFVLAIPAILYIWLIGSKSKYFTKLKALWVLLIIVDVIMI